MSPRSPRQLWLLPVLLITVIATALGALVARSVYTHRSSSPPAVTQPAAPTVQPSEQPGSPEVRGTADASAHPLYGTLRPLLQRYFDAINAKDYEAWKATVTTDRAKKQDVDDWGFDYRSTRDGNIIIYRVETTGDDTARVLLQFTSTQNEEDAPQELPEGCIRWSLVWPFAKEKGEWRLAGGTTSSSPQHEACG